ncbi:MAG: 4-alpha-glucanotransferase [Lachnospiraceae bacterium]
MRSAGILMHISSLPSKYGIGTFGMEAREFVDFLVSAGQTYWQILPIAPTSYGDSPYQSFSSMAGNPYFIDLEILCMKGLLTKSECKALNWGEVNTEVDYGILYQNRFGLLRKAHQRFLKKRSNKYTRFCKDEKRWLDDYAIFMALKDMNGGKSWMEWRDSLRFREEKALDQVRIEQKETIEFYKFLQYLFYEQWWSLKKYANQKGIQIIGDVPIYVAGDSADVWADPELFYLDQNLYPVAVAGCPPDAFSEDGQLWGNPLFRWDIMKKDHYSWWTNRIEKMSELYDIVRIDHFRGFDSYYAIPAGDDTARNGKWMEGPGMDLFIQMEKKLGKLNIIVEDLGFLTPSVLKLVKDSGFPGMRLIQFAFDSRDDSNYLPHNYEVHSIVYTGTHDNDTILGWMKNAPKESVEFAEKYFNLTKSEGYNWGMMRGAWSSVSMLAIVPMQDIIGLSDSARMNTPSTFGTNWKWRAKRGQISKKLAKRVLEYMRMYGRERKNESTVS